MWCGLSCLKILRLPCVVSVPSPPPVFVSRGGLGCWGAALARAAVSMTSSPTHLYLYSHTHSPSCKTWTNTALMFLRIETFVSIVLSYQIQFNVLYTVWQVSCHTSVMLIIHTCLIITDTIGINQRIVTIINEWSNIWKHYHWLWAVSAVSWLTLRCALAGCHP